MEKLSSSLEYKKLKQLIDKKIDEEKNNPKKLYKCEKCKDTGVIVIKYTNEFGLKVEGSRECECSKAKRFQRRIEKSGLKEKFDTLTFEKFEAYNDELKLNKALALGFAKEDLSNTILLLGQSGSGKTHLATAICKEILYEKNTPLIYESYRELIGKIKPLTMNLEERVKAIGVYKDAPVLYIDDLFKGNTTAVDESIIFEILDYRYSRKLKTIITSEKTIEELFDINEALAGRLVEDSKGHILRFDETKNYRLKNLSQKVVHMAVQQLEKYKDEI